MITLQTKILRASDLYYDGTQLAPHWIYRHVGLLGDALVAFVGSASVDLAHMVDLTDVQRKAPIYSPRMLHFLGEWFMDSLAVGVLYQQLFICCAYEQLWEQGIVGLSRSGNDLFAQGKKLSVSIATSSKTSVLMHTGLNIETEGTPIPTSGLKQLGVEPFGFAEAVMEKFQGELANLYKGRVKVEGR